jgi:dTMP kinase
VLLHGDHDLGAVQEVFLFQAARADLVARVIRPALAAGKVVIADRFELSTRAYQAGGGGLPEAAVRAAIELATGGLRPDLYVVLDVTPATGRARQAAQGKTPDRLERRRDEYHAAVAEAFRSANGPGIVHVAADQPADETHRAIWSILAARYPKTFAPVAG